MTEKKQSTHKDLFPVKAYDNREFLHTRKARIIRILAEYMEPEQRFEKFNVKNTIVFFGSARTKPMKQAQEELDEIQEKIKKASDPEELQAELRRAQNMVYMANYYEEAVKLAQKLTEWSKDLNGDAHEQFIICSGGGPGIMEASNKGASLAGGKTIGLNISLPFEQEPNPYITRELSFEFHYFFMRKFWFIYLAKALVIFPGGFGTMDELMETLTLIQTEKIEKKLPIILFGEKYWQEIIDFDALVKWGTISPDDLELFKYAEDHQEAFEYLKEELTNNHHLDE